LTKQSHPFNKIEQGKPTRAWPQSAFQTLSPSSLYTIIGSTSSVDRNVFPAHFMPDSFSSVGWFVFTFAPFHVPMKWSGLIG
jgi:hypothetical protein